MNLGIWTVSAGQSNLKLNMIESGTDSDIYRVEEEYSMGYQAPTGSILSSLDSNESMPVSWTDRAFYCQRSQKAYLVNLLFLSNLSFILLARRNRDSCCCGCYYQVLQCSNSSLSDFDGVQWQDYLSHRTEAWYCCLFFNHSYTSAPEREISQSNKQKIKQNQQKPTK